MSIYNRANSTASTLVHLAKTQPTMSSASRPSCLVRGSISESIVLSIAQTSSDLSPPPKFGTDIDEFYHVPHIVLPGQTISATHTTRRLGGKGGNQAKACASAGAWVVMDASVGDDAEGREAVRRLCEIRGQGGVDGGRVGYWEGGVTGRAVIQLAEDGENSISEFGFLGL